MSEALFDAAPYGPERKKRRRVERPDEIKLYRPWMLLGSAKGPPTAHLLPAKAAPNGKGAWPTLCERHGYRIEIDGHPMVKLCHRCWELDRGRSD